MTTLTQSRVSPTGSTTTNKDVTSPTASSTADVSWTSSAPKKSRFLLRKRTTSSTVPTYTRSQSSSQLSVDSATYTDNEKPKKRSLLSRLLKKKKSPKKSLVIETHPQDDLPAGQDATNQRSDNDEHAQDTAEIDLLQERGQELRLAGQVDEAFATWQEALALAQSLPFNTTIQCNQIRCRMIGLRLQLVDEGESEEHLDQVVELLGQLKPLTRHDNSATLLTPTPRFFDLLIQNDCWSYALQLSHQIPDTPPLTLARLHLEVALQDSDRPIAHLSECHQLLLSVDDAAADPVWKELAQAYASIGEDELAMGCSQSRLELVGNSPHQVALAHYDQAMNVYSPVGQYGLALKEAELALTALEESRTATECEDPAVEGKQADEEAELLLTKLYKLKADVLCRMGRIGDSIESYEQLLQAYLESSSHGPVDAANVLYILGKLSVRTKRFHAAIQYFDRELQMTKSVVGQNHLAISKVLHELARVADFGLMDYQLAVQYYEEALRVETAVYEQCRLQQQEEGATLATSSLMQEARTQMAETKQRMGKLHFQMGDFATAVKTTLSVEK